MKNRILILSENKFQTKLDHVRYPEFHINPQLNDLLSKLFKKKIDLSHYSEDLLKLMLIYKENHICEYIGFFKKNYFLNFSQSKENFVSSPSEYFELCKKILISEKNLYNFFKESPVWLSKESSKNYTNLWSDKFQIDLDKILIKISKNNTFFKENLIYIREKLFKSQNQSFIFLLFMLKKSIFDDYCNYLFNNLFLIEEQINFEKLSIHENNILTVIAKILTDLYFTESIKKSETSYSQIKIIRSFTEKIKDTLPELIPVFKEKSVNITFTANRQYIAYASVLLQSIVKFSNKKNNYDIVILTDDSLTDVISVENLLKKQISSYKNFSIRLFDVSDYFKNVQFKEIDKRLSIATFYRLKIPSIFKNFSKVIFLDTDMLVLEDLSKLFSLDLDKYHIATTKDLLISAYLNKEILFFDEISPTGKRITKTYLQYFTDLGIKYPEKIFQAGLIVFNIPMIRKDNLEKSLEKELVSDKIFRIVDQDILNLVFNDKNILFLSGKWNHQDNSHIRNSKILEKNLPKNEYLEYKENSSKPDILHFSGDDKLWNYRMLSQENKFSVLFWEIASLSPFFPDLIMGFKEIPKENVYNTKPHSCLLTKIIKTILIKIFPYGTYRGLVMRKIVYYFFKKK